MTSLSHLLKSKKRVIKIKNIISNNYSDHIDKAMENYLIENVK